MLNRITNFIKVLNLRAKGIPKITDTKLDREQIKKLVNKENPTILEIGCNDGTSTLWLHEMFENPKVYCFEPDPRAITRFKNKVGQTPNIKLFELALSDKNGEITFFQSGGAPNPDWAKGMPEGWDFSGSIRPPKEHLKLHPNITFDNKITVETKTLDTWCEEQGIENIDFIWMDVQGAEIDVFRGATKSLNKVRFIYTEYNNDELYEGQYNLVQLMSYLKKFKILIRYSGDILLKNSLLN